MDLSLQHWLFLLIHFLLFPSNPFFLCWRVRVIRFLYSLVFYIIPFLLIDILHTTAVSCHSISPFFNH